MLIFHSQYEIFASPCLWKVINLREFIYAQKVLMSKINKYILTTSKSNKNERSSFIMSLLIPYVNVELNLWMFFIT